MRFTSQIFFLLVFTALFLLGFKNGWWADLAGRTASPEDNWQTGIWAVQDQAAAEIQAQLEEFRATGLPVRLAVRLDSELPAYRLSAWNEVDFIRFLSNLDSMVDLVQFVPPDITPPPDLLLELKLQSCRQKDEGDELAGIMRCKSDAGETETAFQVTCPPGGRAWFVKQNRQFFSGDLLLVLTALTTIGIGVWSARQTFSGRFDRSRSLNLSLIFVLGAFLLFMFQGLLPDGHGFLGIPRWSTKVVLDTSDSVRFPVDDYLASIDSAQKSVDLNDVCLFVLETVKQISNSAQNKHLPAGAGFKAWLRYLRHQPEGLRLLTESLDAAGDISIFYNLPLFKTADSPRSLEPETMNEKVARTSPSSLPVLLKGGSYGQLPGFFLPWTELESRASRELLVVFWTGEPGSMSQASWLENNRASLSGLKPDNLRVLSILLPALPRSAYPGWSGLSRLRNVTAVSDEVLITQPAQNSANQAWNFKVPFKVLPVFAELPLDEQAVSQAAIAQAQGDLNIARARVLQADKDVLLDAAKRIAVHSQGLSDTRENNVFQASFLALQFSLWAIGGLWLFLRLQAEIRLLDQKKLTNSFEWLGGLLGAAMGILSALLICYITADPQKWFTRTGPALVLWGVVWLWYLGVWLPVLIGRSLVVLPAPEKMLRVRHLTIWITALLGLICLLILTGAACKYLAVKNVWSEMFFLAGLGLTGAICLGLGLRYQWVSFWRHSRRRVWILGFAGLLILLLLPLSDYSPGGIPNWTMRCGFSLIALLLPAVGALTAYHQWRGQETRTTLGLGWSGLIWGLLLGIIVPLLLLFPVSV